MTTSTPERRVMEQPPRQGFHLHAWLSEFAGTALVLAIGVSSICLALGAIGRQSPLPYSARLLLVGLVFGATAAMFSITSWGRLSGAHLNPVITLTFWLLGKAHWHDLVGYVTAQLLGAIAGTSLAALVWSQQAQDVSFGATQPGPGITALKAAGLEAAMTAIIVLLILFMASHPRTTRYMPVALTVVIGVLVWQMAPFTGASMNPARSLGPAIFAQVTSNYWIYVVGPIIGGLIATAVYRLVPAAKILTTKMFHDSSYPTTMASTLRVSNGESPD
jgi:aquaporin Z